MNSKLPTQVITCTVCPIGCEISVYAEDQRICRLEGARCRRGDSHARDEFLHPLRVFTSSVRLLGGLEPLLPVRSSTPVAKAQLLACSAALNGVEVASPVRCGDIVVKNVLGMGVDIIATLDA